MLGKAHASLGLLGGTTAVIMLGTQLGDTASSPFATMPLTSAAAVIVGGGAGLLPDVDSRGTLVRCMGVLGTLLHKVALGLSAFVWNLTATKHDTLNKWSKYHRLLTHTIFFSLLIFGGIYVSTQLPTWGTYLGILYAGVCLTAVTALFYAPVYKKYRSAFGANVLLVVGVCATAFMMTYGARFDPTLTDPHIVGVMFAGSALLGMLTHTVIGDGITEEGVPLLAPFVKWKGKRWYRFHFLGIRVKADSPFVNRLLEVVSGALVLALIGTSVWLGYMGQTWGEAWSALVGFLQEAF